MSSPVVYRRLKAREALLEAAMDQPHPTPALKAALREYERALLACEPDAQWEPRPGTFYGHYGV